jgi:hypothetical protein
MHIIRRKYQWKIGRNMLDFPRFSCLPIALSAGKQSGRPGDWPQGA